MKDSPKQQIAFFEEEVKEILGKPPRYLVRWGISLYLLLFCIILVLSATINYPVYSKFEAKINPTNTGESIQLDSLESIKKALVSDGMTVDENQVLFETNDRTIKSSASGTVRFLRPIVDGYSENSTTEIMLIIPKAQNYNLTLKVPISKINKIKIGQRLTFSVDSKIIDGTVESIPAEPSKDGFYLVKAKSESNQTFIRNSEEILVDLLVDNKKIFNKILNL